MDTMTDNPTPETTPDLGDEWISTERLDAILSIAAAFDEAGNTDAADAINELLGENLVLRQNVVVSTGAFTVMARVLDSVIYAADKMGQKKIVQLIEHLMQAEGLLNPDEKLSKQDSGLIIPDTKTTKKITHKGRITEVS